MSAAGFDFGGKKALVFGGTKGIGWVSIGQGDAHEKEDSEARVEAEADDGDHGQRLQEVAQIQLELTTLALRLIRTLIMDTPAANNGHVRNP